MDTGAEEQGGGTVTQVVRRIFGRPAAANRSWKCCVSQEWETGRPRGVTKTSPTSVGMPAANRSRSCTAWCAMRREVTNTGSGTDFSEAAVLSCTRSPLA